MFKALKLVGFFNLGISPPWTVQKLNFSTLKLSICKWISEKL